MKIKYFAWIREITKSEEEGLNIVEVDNLDKLKSFLSSKYPDLKKHLDKEILRFAIN
jgi:molybdopterin converting factor small subunit